MLAVIRFRIGESLRFLSHAETIRVFQRACVRAGVQIAYSQGFNPHQKMSLVPPRSVGVESNDDLLCLWLKEGQTEIDVELLKAELPAGIEIISVKTSEAKNIPEPISARYVMKVQWLGHPFPGKQKIDDGTKKHITDILASDKFVVNRRTGENSKTKPVDVRPFLESIKAEAGEFTVDCKISAAGTIRVDEILNLLGLAVEDLAGPVIRTTVQYSECKMQN
jgi:radical SAM-linked protein